MKTLTDHLSAYAAYHRNPRNVATHFVGIPMIVVAIQAVLSRPAIEMAGVPVSPALLASVVAVAFYLSLDAALGLLMGALFALGLCAGAWAAAQPTTAWLTMSVATFVVGWVLQFIGHAFEGRKPAFLDDIAGLIIGPLFVVAEALFLLGLRPGLQAAIEARAGSLRTR